MSMNKSVGTAGLVGIGVTALVFFIALVAPRATTAVAAAQEAEKVGELQAQAGARLAAYTPDPVNFPVPRTPWDGKPDFTGVYWTSTFGINPTSAVTRKVLESLYRPEVRAARAKRNPEESAAMHCWPETPVVGGMHPILNNQLVSVPGFLAVINEYGGNYRLIPTDGLAHDPAAPPTFLGDSVGHWEGDTLVVDVTNFRPYSIASNRFFDTWSDALHIVERWTRPDARYFEYQVVVEDPKSLTARWTPPTIRRGLMAYDMAQENFCLQDDVMETINQEQFKASETVRRPR